MKKTIKKIVKLVPIAFTRNQQYDKQTKKIISKVCTPASNCIDIGAHKGEVLDVILKHASHGTHYAFEPIPDLYNTLITKYSSLPNCHISDIALNNEKGITSFNYVISNPSYSGLVKRKYDRPNEQDISIEVKTDRLDDVLPSDYHVELIKIDVEGGELRVLEGAVKTIKKNRPYIIFEHGLGASDFYGSTPDKVYNLITSCDLKVGRLKDWLKKRRPLTLEEFEKIYRENSDYYFIAYP